MSRLGSYRSPVVHQQGKAKLSGVLKGIKPKLSGSENAKSKSVVVTDKPSKNDDDLKFVVHSLWTKTKSELDDAPEIYILHKQSHLETHEKTDFLTKLLRLLGTLCKNRAHASYGLANFKPITARTNHTLEYVKECVTKYSKSAAHAIASTPATSTNPVNKTPQQSTRPSVKGAPSASSNNKLSTKAVPGKGPAPPPTPAKSSAPVPSPKSKPTPSKPSTNKNQLLKEFYEMAHQTLEYLQKGIRYYKEIILTLSFTRYAEFKLTSMESKLTQGKSIIGSCVWTVTCALKQLQEDPAIEQFETMHGVHTSNKNKTNSNSLLHDLAAEMLVLVNLSLDTWKETITAVNILERIHVKTEDLFRKQTSHFHNHAPPDSDEAIAASVHLKKFRRSQSEALEIHKFNRQIHSTGMKRRKLPYPRVLFKTNYSKPDSIWQGFDPLPVSEKVSHLKDVMKFMKGVLESVKDTAQKIAVQLQGSHQKQAGITCYENGIEMMEQFLNKNAANIDWSKQETEEFFETDKIFLDDMDVISLGAGVTRTILHDTRHIFHIAYETSRFLNFKEFISLPEYDKVHKMFYKSKAGSPQNKRTGLERLLKGRSSDSHDIEELELDLRELNSLFRNSPYYEVTKALPIYCTHVGLTLQDTDLVFTPSSEKLLTSYRSVVL